MDDEPMMGFGGQPGVRSAIGVAPVFLALLVILLTGQLVGRREEPPLERVDQQAVATGRRLVSSVPLQLPFSGDMCGGEPWDPLVVDGPLHVRIEATLELSVNQRVYDGLHAERIALADLPRVLQRDEVALTMGIRERVVVLDAVESVPWGYVVKVMDTIRGVEIRSLFIDELDGKLAVELATKEYRR